MYIAVLGILVLLVVAVSLSTNRRGINKRIVISAFLLQLGIAVFALYVPYGKVVLEALTHGVDSIFEYANSGISFIFGSLADESMGFIFFIKVLPVIIFISALMSVLYYFHIMQWIVVIVGGFLRKVIGISRVEALCTAANIFVGQTEAPLVVKPYIRSLSRSQLFTVMATGMSSVSGTILVGYAALGIQLDYLLIAAFMAAPGGLLMAKLIYPDDGQQVCDEDIFDVDIYEEGHRPVNVIEAAAEGAEIGLKLAATIGAMLLAFVALISLCNGLLSGVGGWFGLSGFTFEQLLGYVFAPLMYLIGIPWEEAYVAGNLVGQKLILNEFVAYANMAPIQDSMSPHTRAVVTFALCGFANLSSLAIQLGGLGILVPERRSEIAALGLRAVAAGTLSNLMSAALASLVLLGTIQA